MNQYNRHCVSTMCILAPLATAGPIILSPTPPLCDIVMHGSEVYCEAVGDTRRVKSNVIKYGPTAIPTTTRRQYYNSASGQYDNISPQCESTNPTISVTYSETFTETWGLSTTYEATIALSAARKLGSKSISQTVGLTGTVGTAHTYSYNESFSYGNTQTYSISPIVEPCWNYTLVPYVRMQDYIIPFGYWKTVTDFDVWCDSYNDGYSDTIQSGELRCILIEGAGNGSVMISGVAVEDRGSSRIDDYQSRCPCLDDSGGGGGGGDDDDSGGNDDGGGGDDGGCDCSDDLDPNGDEDGDGTPNGEDDTPYGYDGGDPDGDDDGDGTPNSDDATPYGYDGDDPDGDDDGDGIPNSQDPDPNCPLDPEGDNDYDGTPNCEDDTPNGEDPPIDPDLKDAILDEIDGLTRNA